MQIWARLIFGYYGLLVFVSSFIYVIGNAVMGKADMGYFRQGLVPVPSFTLLVFVPSFICHGKCRHGLGLPSDITAFSCLFLLLYMSWEMQTWAKGGTDPHGDCWVNL